MRTQRTAVVVLLGLITACEGSTPTSISPDTRISPATPTGPKPAFDGWVNDISGQTEIYSAGSYGYTACLNSVDPVDGTDIEFWLNGQPANRYHITSLSDACRTQTVNVTTTTADFTIFAVAKTDGFNVGTSNTLTVHNYTRPLTVSIVGYTTVNTGAECEYDAMVSGGKSPYTYQWDVDNVHLSDSGSVIYETFLSDGAHSVTVGVTDALGHSTLTTLYLTSQSDPPERGCPVS